MDRKSVYNALPLYPKDDGSYGIKVTEYCNCPKKPGGILEILGEPGPHMIHAKCGKEIGPMPAERKPVFCAHPALEAEVDNRTLCLTCHSVWINGDEPPQVAIAYMGEGEK